MVNVIEKSLRTSIKNLTKDMHMKNEMNRTIDVAVIRFFPKNPFNILKYCENKINSEFCKTIGDAEAIYFLCGEFVPLLSLFVP